MFPYRLEARAMIIFEVPDMTCGHCVSAITRAVLAVDPAAQVEVALDRHQVKIAAGSASTETLRDAIAEAGYSPADAVSADGG
jgi:copper chaperone